MDKIFMMLVYKFMSVSLHYMWLMAVRHLQTSIEGYNLVEEIVKVRLDVQHEIYRQENMIEEETLA